MKIIVFMLVALSVIGCVNTACTSYPLSLSQMNSCVDNYCTFDSFLTLAMDASSKDATCIVFTSPDNRVVSQTVYFEFLQAEFIRPMIGGYWTDDPLTYACCACWCHKDNPSPPACGDCPAGTHNYEYCFNGEHNDFRCYDPPVFGIGGDENVLGKFTCRVGLEGYRRYRIQQWGAPVMNAVLTVRTHNESRFESFTGQIANLFTSSLPINVSIISSTSSPSYDIQYSIYDITSPYDYYILSPNEINSEQNYDPSLLGWFKIDKSKVIDDTILGDTTTAFVDDCPDGHFEVDYPFFSIADYLTKKEDFLGSGLSPNSYLDDPFFIKAQSKLNTPTHKINPYSNIVNGWLLADVNRQPIFIGIDDNGFMNPATGNLIPTFSMLGLTTQASFTQNHGTYDLSGNGGYYSQQVTIYNYVSGWDTPNPVKQLFNLRAITFGALSGLCVQYSFNNLTCDRFNFITIGWPDQILYKYSYNGTFTKELVYDQYGLPSPTLHQPLTNGAFTLEVVFSDMGIYFNDTLTIPEIVDISVNGSSFIATIKSDSVKGTCYADGQPSTMVAQRPVQLDTTPSTFSFSAIPPSYNGSFTLFVRCKENIVNTTFILSYDNTFIPVPNESGDATNNNNNNDRAGYSFGDFMTAFGNGMAAFGGGVVNGLIDFAHVTVGLAGDLYKFINDLVNGSWLKYLIIIGIVIVAIVLFAVLIGPIMSVLGSLFKSVKSGLSKATSGIKNKVSKKNKTPNNKKNDDLLNNISETNQDKTEISDSKPTSTNNNDIRNRKKTIR